MKINNLECFKEKVARGEFAIGAVVGTSDPTVTEIACAVGFDFVFIDGEHGNIDRDAAMKHLMAVKGTGVASFYRVPACNHTEIKKVIDFAPAGIIVPMVKNAEEARLAIEAMRYPPAGSRGCGFRRGLEYGCADFDSYWDASAHDPMVILQLEHIDAYRDLDRILALPGLDSIMIGPYDFSASMGKAGQWDNPELRRIFDDACCRIRAAGVMLGVALDVRAEEWRARGAQWMAVKGDMTALTERWREVVRELRRPSGS